MPAAGGGDNTNNKADLKVIAQDSHPFAKGAVIEVWHIPKSKVSAEDDWWSEEESDDDDNEDEGAANNNNATNGTVLLCDIIDRELCHPLEKNGGGDRWKYYVHYRDFNRRMDEWVGVHRIVSPPSVGNAKVRAKKRGRKRKQQQTQNPPKENNLLSSSNNNSSSNVAPTTTGGGPTPDDTAAASSTSGRRTRLRRKSTPSHLAPDSTEDDAVTVVAANNKEAAPTAAAGSSGAPAVTAARSTSHTAATALEDVAIVEAAVTTTTVGEHTVATVQAVELDEHEGLDEASLREHEEVTKIKNVGFLELGRHQMETWYYSPLPKELIGGVPSSGKQSGSHGFLDILYVCEFTLRMFARKSELRRFQSMIQPADRHPPGNEIYRHDNLAMFEIDGLQEKVYCQNLCYIAKLFLDHKTLYYDVDPFLFYVLCELDGRGFHPVGYFSKEKYSDVGYNLACILSFPAHQRKGYGRFLIAFSYELTKKEEKVGSPEKPMSDLGQQAYKPYWASTIIDFLLHQSTESSLSVMDISKRTSIMAEDIVYTLNQLGMLKIINHVYFVAAERNLLSRLAQKYPIKKPRVEPSKLHWTPFLTDIRRDKFSIHSKKPSLEVAATTTTTTLHKTKQATTTETSTTTTSGRPPQPRPPSGVSAG